MSDKNLAPYFLAIGPLLLVGAYMNWPAADAIGARGAQSLIDEADSLMPLLIMATLGTLMVLGGLYLLISLNVLKTLKKDCFKGFLKSVISSIFFCLTNKNKGIENINHQTATDRKEYKIPSV